MALEDKIADAAEDAAEQSAEDAQPTKAADAPDKPEEEAESTDKHGQEEADLTDKHGQEAVAKGRYERDMAEKDAQIAELKQQVAESAKTEAGRKELEDKIKALEGSQADMRTDYELKLAGCRDDKAVKAAKALLGDCGGDVAKLKAEAPYLFESEKKTGSTGFKPQGAAKGLDEKLDRAFGVKSD